MSKSIFISFVHEDIQYINNIKFWAEHQQLDDVVIITETEDKRHEGGEAIKHHIKSKIQTASAVVVLIGQDTHNHDWIKAEIELANSFNKKIICIRIPNTTGAVPPILNNYTPIRFKMKSLKSELAKL